MAEKRLSVGIYTLGCKVNQYESEAIAEALEAGGFTIADHNSKCDAYIINTCTVTAESDRKARQFIRRAAAKNPMAFIAVTGCLAETSPKDIAKIGGVDFICGNSRKLSVVDALLVFAEKGQKNNEPEIIQSTLESAPFEEMSITKFDRTRAYVKIEDGCENRCTYCIIPSARGRIRSKSPEDVIAEVEALTRGGCREVVLTGIETASYGRDIKNVDLASLLCRVDKINGIGRVRLGSLDPSLMTDRFVSRLAGLRSLTPHFHLSLQSGSDRILALMKRKYNSRMAFEGMERLKRVMPDAMFTTDIIVGFPGETDEDFEATVDFVKKARFLSAHIFTYSKRAGTPAAAMADQIPESVKKDRSARLISLQNEIREEILSAQIGKEYDVLFETHSDGFSIGHTPSFIEIKVKYDRPMPGEIHRVRIIGTADGLCLGELI